MANFYAYPGRWLIAARDIKSQDGKHLLKGGEKVQLLFISKGVLVSKECTGFSFVGKEGFYSHAGENWKLPEE